MQGETAAIAHNFLSCDRDQPLLLPPDLRAWLPEDHLAWFVIEAIDELDLEPFYAAYRADGHGRAAHEPKMMVGLLAYADAVGERSSRQIERRCREDVAFRVICTNQAPDHATIARFRVRHERALADLFGRTSFAAFARKPPRKAKAIAGCASDCRSRDHCATNRIETVKIPVVSGIRGQGAGRPPSLRRGIRNGLFWGGGSALLVLGWRAVGGSDPASPDNAVAAALYSGLTIGMVMLLLDALPNRWPLPVFALAAAGGTFLISILLGLIPPRDSVVTPPHPWLVAGAWSGMVLVIVLFAAVLAARHRQTS